MDSLTSPLLPTPTTHDPDPMATPAEIAAVIALAHARRARTLVIGSGRTPHALATARRIDSTWTRAGGITLATVTWPETAASWLRQATRFVAAAPDLWVMTGPATGWAQMTRRLLWSTPWPPTHTLATAALAAPHTLTLVGLPHLNGLTGAAADGTTWRVTNDALTSSPPPNPHPRPTD
ncbi:hypothetical protein AB0O05_26345 [Streptomyces sp. NPDC093084]|uniref:hypothetical protein n=1 Tax=Streptomyces sp. NPDC093084 TaxID=3155197 RepID=UPI00343C69ED